MISVLICDDHPIVREGLKQILSTCTDIVVAGEASSCREALMKTRQETFDIVLLDIIMPDRSGLDIISEIKHKKPDLPILMLSAYPEERYGVTALKSGASGYLMKKSLPGKVITAIRDICDGRKYISPNLATRMVSYLNAEESVLPHEKLSGREYQVMRMIAAGKKSPRSLRNC